MRGFRFSCKATCADGRGPIDAGWQQRKGSYISCWHLQAFAADPGEQTDGCISSECVRVTVSSEQ